MKQGLIFDIKRYAIHDGPGIRTTVFMKGCSLTCSWCHNPEGIYSGLELMFWDSRCIGCQECLNACEKGAISFDQTTPRVEKNNCDLCGDCTDACPCGAMEMVGRTVTLPDLMTEIEKDRVFYDESGGGVTFSGGEPLLQHVFLSEVLRECKVRGINTCVDTSGAVPYEVFQSVIGSVDLFLYDLKVMGEKKHLEFTGVTNRTILENLKRLDADGARILVRIPLIPGVNDADVNIRETADFVLGLESVKDVSLLPYHAIAEQKYERLQKGSQFQKAEKLSDERVAEIKNILEESGLNVKIGS